MNFERRSEAIFLCLKITHGEYEVITKTGKRLVEEHRLDKQASLAIGLGTMAGTHIAQNLGVRALLRNMAEKGGIGEHLLHAIATGRTELPMTFSNGMKDALLPERKMLYQHLGELGTKLHSGITQAVAENGGRLNKRTAVMAKWLLSGDIDRVVRAARFNPKAFKQALSMVKEQYPDHYGHISDIIQQAANNSKVLRTADGETLLAKAVRNHGVANVPAKAMEAVEDISKAIKENELTGGIAQVFSKPHLARRLQEAAVQRGTVDPGMYRLGDAVGSIGAFASGHTRDAELLNLGKRILASNYTPKQLGAAGEKALNSTREWGANFFVKKPVLKAYNQGLHGVEYGALTNGIAINGKNAITGNIQALANRFGNIAHRFSGEMSPQELARQQLKNEWKAKLGIGNGTTNERIMADWNKPVSMKPQVPAPKPASKVESMEEIRAKLNNQPQPKKKGLFGWF